MIQLERRGKSWRGGVIFGIVGGRLADGGRGRGRRWETDFLERLATGSLQRRFRQKIRLASWQSGLPGIFSGD